MFSNFQYLYIFIRDHSNDNDEMITHRWYQAESEKVTQRQTLL